MRFAFAMFLMLAGACSAIDDFDRFSFGDMTPPPPGFGEPCSGQCAVGDVDRPLTCYTMMGGHEVPGGLCTRPCNLLAGTDCSEYPRAVCTRVEGMELCLSLCNPSMSVWCRFGFSCCDTVQMVLGPGACAPTETDFCH